MQVVSVLKLSVLLNLSCVSILQTEKLLRQTNRQTYTHEIAGEFTPALEYVHMRIGTYILLHVRLSFRSNTDMNQ